jgi:hypothetical protein
MAIVMINEHRERALGVTRSDHEEPIETFGTDGPNESVRDPYCRWGPDRRTNDANLQPLEHLVEALAGLRVRTGDVLEQLSNATSASVRPLTN